MKVSKMKFEIYGWPTKGHGVERGVFCMSIDGCKKKRISQEICFRMIRDFIKSPKMKCHYEVPEQPKVRNIYKATPLCVFDFEIEVNW